jgi:hypothetical protein
MERKKLFGFWSQVVVQIEAFEEAFAHILGDVQFFDGSMHKVNRSPGGVQDNTAIITTGEVLFKFLAKFRVEFTVNI